MACAGHAVSTTGCGSMALPKDTGDRQLKARNELQERETSPLPCGRRLDIGWQMWVPPPCERKMDSHAMPAAPMRNMLPLRNELVEARKETLRLQNSVSRVHERHCNAEAEAARLRSCNENLTSEFKSARDEANCARNEADQWAAREAAIRDQLSQGLSEATLEDRFRYGLAEARMQAAELQAELGLRRQQERFETSLAETHAELTRMREESDHWQWYGSQYAQAAATFEDKLCRQLIRWSRLCTRRLDGALLADVYKAWCDALQSTKHAERWESRECSWRRHSEDQSSRWLGVTGGLAKMVFSQKASSVMTHCLSAWRALTARSAVAAAVRSRGAASFTKQDLRACLAAHFTAWRMRCQSRKSLARVSGAMIGDSGNMLVSKVFQAWMTRKRQRRELMRNGGLTAQLGSREQPVLKRNVLHAWRQVFKTEVIEQRAADASVTVMQRAAQVRRLGEVLGNVLNGPRSCRLLLTLTLRAWDGLSSAYRGVRHIVVEHSSIAASERRRRLSLDHTLLLWGHEARRGTLAGTLFRWRLTTVLERERQDCHRESVLLSRRLADHRDEEHGRVLARLGCVKRALGRQRLREYFVLPLYVVFRSWWHLILHRKEAKLLTRRVHDRFRRIRAKCADRQDLVCLRMEEAVSECITRHCLLAWASAVQLARHDCVLEELETSRQSEAIVRESSIMSDLQIRNRVRTFVSHVFFNQHATLLASAVLSAWRLCGMRGVARSRLMSRSFAVKVGAQLAAHKDPLGIRSCLNAWHAVVLESLSTTSASWRLSES
eukprot:TRINITY_DN30424_c0_g1_i1.p1 TRINITY_DN30424_c0_g1~~TRINITY_DN30424_c0_g1_i1.p1  ORF type:complete len:781 (+),score=73.40 TRINITY_DN30424_c0_g1_i1:48-2390(+)